MWRRIILLLLLLLLLYRYLNQFIEKHTILIMFVKLYWKTNHTFNSNSTTMKLNEEFVEWEISGRWKLKDVAIQ
jgi:hypothetical protein